MSGTHEPGPGFIEAPANETRQLVGCWMAHGKPEPGFLLFLAVAVVRRVGQLLAWSTSASGQSFHGHTRVCPVSK